MTIFSIGSFTALVDPTKLQSDPADSTSVTDMGAVESMGEQTLPFEDLEATDIEAEFDSDKLVDSYIADQANAFVNNSWII